MAEVNVHVGRLQVEPIRKAFPKEALDFTTWLETHIEALSERLGVDLSVIEREKGVGDFNVDLLCEYGEEKRAIIENQLEKTDHDHLGKMLTYLVNLDASMAVWITTEPRPEHQKVVAWLNESTSADLSFYLLKIEAIRIANSPIAPLFTVLAGPDVQSKKIGEKKKEWAERHHKRHNFWVELLEKSRGKTKLFSTISPGRANWIGTGAGKSGVKFNYVVINNWAAVELYIDHDHETGEKNRVILDALHEEKEIIEAEFGEQLEWEKLEEKRACRIRKRFMDEGLESPDSWPSLQDEMINKMIILDRILRPRLAKIDL
jgi:hypothetical protein